MISKYNIDVWILYRRQIMNQETSVQKKYLQSDFFDLLDNKAPHNLTNSKRRPLPIRQQKGFRKEYDEAMITLYIIGYLFKSSKEQLPETIQSMQKKAQKTQIRYERYMPKAGQKLIHYGRDVVDAYLFGNRTYLDTLTRQAAVSKHKDKWRICIFAQDTVDKMFQIIRSNNLSK